MRGQSNMRFACAALGCLALAGQSAEPTRALTSDLELSGQQQLEFIRGLVFEWAPRERPVAGTTTPPVERGLSLAGREDLFAEHRWSQLPICQAALSDAVAVLRLAARQSHVVIVNEHHDSSRDRLFVGQLLRALKREGFQYYAAETFAPNHSVNHPGLAASDGMYLNEPVFGRLAESAKKLGYQLVSYEAGPEQDAAFVRLNPSVSQHDRRERLQVENLIKNLFSRDPDARVVIHVGHNHVRERNNRVFPDTKWMAQVLKEKTGIDPLTISQLSCRSDYSGDVISTNAQGSSEEGAVDLFLGHPRPVFRDGRPTWRRELGDRAIPVPAEYEMLQERVLIEAREVAASPGTVAVDRVLQYPGEHLHLMLPPGRYRVEAFPEHGAIEGRAIVVKVP